LGSTGMDGWDTTRIIEGWRPKNRYPRPLIPRRRRANAIGDGGRAEDAGDASLLGGSRRVCIGVAEPGGEVHRSTACPPASSPALRGRSDCRAETSVFPPYTRGVRPGLAFPRCPLPDFPPRRACAAGHTSPEHSVHHYHHRTVEGSGSPRKRRGQVELLRRVPASWGSAGALGCARQAACHRRLLLCASGESPLQTPSLAPRGMAYGP
jgi:hypothetical protein